MVNQEDTDLIVHDQQIIVIFSFCIEVPIIIFLGMLLTRLAIIKLALWYVIILITLMILANLSWLISQLYQLFALKSDDYYNREEVIVSGFFLMVACCCFSLSHWIFSFKYWKCSQRLTLLLSKQKPDKNDTQMNMINWVICILNVVFSVLYAWAYTLEVQN